MPPAESHDEISARHASTREVLAPSWIEEWLEAVEPDFADTFSRLKYRVEEKCQSTWQILDETIQALVSELALPPNTNIAVQRAMQHRREAVAAALMFAVKRFLTIAENSTLSIRDCQNVLLEQIQNRLGATDPLVILLTSMASDPNDSADLSFDDGSFESVAAARVTVPEPVRPTANARTGSPSLILMDAGVRALMLAGTR